MNPLTQLATVFQSIPDPRKHRSASSPPSAACFSRSLAKMPLDEFRNDFASGVPLRGKWERTC